MARCEECLHFEVCEALEQGNGLMKVSPIHCGYYKPTADVAPKSEVERLRELNNSLLEAGQEWQKRYENLAREIFEEIEKIGKTIKLPGVFRDGVLEIVNAPFLCIEPSDVAELKKKYTEGESNG